MDEKMNCCLNYEAEYESVLAKYNQLLEKHTALEKDFHSLESAYARVNAQMEIVHLIFGRR